jgi:hypothetical protein
MRRFNSFVGILGSMAMALVGNIGEQASKEFLSESL